MSLWHFAFAQQAAEYLRREERAEAARDQIAVAIEKAAEGKAFAAIALGRDWQSFLKW
jgi:hypothetical protein